MKKQGPIRSQVVIFLILFIVCVAGYFKFFFDHNLRMLIQWAGTKANYAEVNVSEVKTSFFKFEVKINGLEVTNFSQPKENLVSFSEFTFRLKPDAILRAKIVIEEASLYGLTFFERRKSPGQIYPELKAKAEAEAAAGNGLTDVAVATAKKSFEAQTSESVLGDFVNILSTDDLSLNLKDLSVELESEKNITSLTKDFNEKKEGWKNSYKDLKDLKEVKALFNEAKSIKFSKEPKELLAQINEVKKLHEEFKSEVKQTKKQINDIKADVVKYQNAAKNIDDWIKTDIANLKNYFKIPSLDFSTLPQAIFGQYFSEMIGPYQGWIEKVQAYAPKKANKEDAPVPPPRGEGLTITFPKKYGYPLFWLQKAALSSSSPEKGNLGFQYQMMGELLDISSDQMVTDKPWVAILAGSLPDKELLGIKFKTSIDKRTPNVSAINLHLGIDSYPISDLELVDTSEMEMVLNKSKGSASLEGKIVNQEMDFMLKTSLTNFVWTIETPKSLVTEILRNVFNRFNSIDISTQFLGNWRNPRLRLKSNLDEELSRSLKVEFNQKLAEAQSKLKSIVEDKIAEKKEQWLSSMGETEAGLLKPLLAQNLEMDKMDQNLSQLTKDLEKQQKDKLKSKAKGEANKALDKLKGKFGF